MDEHQHSDLESRKHPVCEDMPYQLKVWRFERWGWYALVAVVLMGLLGVFSRGPLSAREVHSADGRLSAHYEIFHRNGSTNPMKIAVSGRPESPVEIELSGDFLDGFSIESMQPEPVKSVSAGDGIKVWLQTDPHGRATLYLTLRGDGLGGYTSRLSVPGSSPVNVTQYILP
ncbi:hypothetical protein [Pseudomonas fluorescens]|uniref:hypothetical protein n=1 Tax=Pseudomonas fluorescens TaxID=294 RepID=UPI00124253BB|nr:hypothetical protein [Pseudomonas fluorescens]VVM76155.1 hypothetical protein PS676_02030 [Pseudomonas fluorescens]